MKTDVSLDRVLWMTILNHIIHHALSRTVVIFRLVGKFSQKAKPKTETAVFGATCRHDFLQKFFSLKQRERLGYAVFLLEHFINTNPDKNLNISYDIACLPEKHLNKCKRHDILSNVSFSVPIFHCYGHSMSCQVNLNPEKQQGLGLTDGEGIKRLWSYLGFFSKITKEMSPENRTDLLTDGLLHYAKKMKDKMGID